MLAWGNDLWRARCLNGWAEVVFALWAPVYERVGMAEFEARQRAPKERVWS